MNSVPHIDLEAARVALSLLDPALAAAHDVVPSFGWKTKPSGFAGLVLLILEQQVSVASAAAVWRRLEAALGTINVEEILARDVDELRLHGLSTQKARYVRAVAEAQIAGHIDFDRLHELSDEEASAGLRQIKGIGRWTSEAFLMICEKRTDFFPAGDIALQEAIRVLDGVPARPTEKALYARAEAWRPYRSAAAHLLWEYYRGLKLKTIQPPA